MWSRETERPVEAEAALVHVGRTMEGSGYIDYSAQNTVGWIGKPQRQSSTVPGMTSRHTIPFRVASHTRSDESVH